MKIKKHIKIEKIIIPASEIRVTDQLEAIMLEVMKFIKLKQKTHHDEIRIKLGFTELITKAIINRLELKFLISSKNNSIELNSHGNNYLNRDKIFEDKIIELRLIVTDSPHFVLRHSFYLLSENYYSSNITKNLLEKRRKISGLLKSITKIGEEVYCFEVQDAIMEIGLHEISNENSNRILKIKSHVDKYKYRVEIDPNDDEVISDLKRISELLGLNRIESLNYSLQSMEALTGFQVQLNELEGEIFELELNSRANVSVENLLKLNNWLNVGVWNKTKDKWIIELVIFNGWFVDIEFSLVSTTNRVFHLLFSQFILTNTVDELLDSQDFKRKVEIDWEKFIEAFAVEKFDLDHELLFKLFWKFPKNQSIAKLMASRLIEEVILN